MAPKKDNSKKDAKVEKQVSNASAGSGKMKEPCRSARGYEPTTDKNTGLTEQEVIEFQQEFGYNELPADETKWYIQLAKKFIGPMPIIIWIGIILEGIFQDWASFIVLWIMQLGNGLLGFYEERKAGNALEELEGQLASVAHVKRNGTWADVPARDLVEGDVIHVKLGDVIPADGRLFAGSGLPLIIDQASINGESLPATKEANDTCYQGTICKRGEADILVCQTGLRTFLGRAADKVNEAGLSDAGEHFAKMVFQITLWLTVISLVACACIAIRIALLKAPGREVALTVVVVLIAAVPIAIEVVSTSTLAIGSRMMAKEKALITRLASIEELGAMNLLCSDKTGTLTLNRLTVKKPVFTVEGSGFTEDDVIMYGALSAKLEGGLQNLDAIDKVVRQELDNRKIDISIYNQDEFIPFDPVSKRTEGTIKEIKSGNTWKCSKGAPQVILAMAHNHAEIEEVVSESVLSSARRGFRTIGVAVQKTPGKWEFAGLIQLYDPPRHDTSSTVKKAQMLGVEVKMITGDQKAIGEETLRQLNMGDLVYTPEILHQNDEATALQLVQNCNGMAEVFPEHKFEIVQLLQKVPGNRVGMTGDGVNDAPALKAADVGIAVSDCTDAARAASDIVLLDDGLSVIIAGIRISRAIFQRLRNYMIFRITESAQLLLFFFFAIICILPADFFSNEEVAWIENKMGKPESEIPKSFMVPVIALVLITILNDGAMLTLAYDNVIPQSVPCKWHLLELLCQSTLMGIVSMGNNILILLIGLWATSSTNWFTTTFFMVRTTYPQVLGMVYLAKSIAGFMSVFTSRTGVSFFWVSNPHWLLWSAAIVANGLSIVFACTWPFSGDGVKYYDRIDGISWQQCLFVIVWCLLWFLLQDLAKVIFLKIWHTVGKTDMRKVDLRTQRSSFWAVKVDGDMTTRSLAQTPGGGIPQIVSQHTMVSVNRTPHSADPEHHVTVDAQAPARNISF